MTQTPHIHPPSTQRALTQHTAGFGQCQGCKSYGTLEEVRIAPEVRAGGEGMSAARRVVEGLAAAAPGRGASGGVGGAAASAAVRAAAATARSAAASAGYGAEDDGGDADGPDYAALVAEADGAYDPTAPSLFGDSGGGGGSGRARSSGSSGTGSGGGTRTRRQAAGTWVASGGAEAGPELLAAIRRDASAARLALPGATGAEVGRALGGGVVPGSVVLVGGDPGVGKSTLLLQVAALAARACQAGGSGDAADGESAEAGKPKRRGHRSRAATDEAAAAESSAASEQPQTEQQQHQQPVPAAFAGRPVLYVTAEESKHQVHDRASRLGLLEGAAPPPVALLSESSLDAALEAVARLRPGVVIIDSVQTVVLGGVEGRAGSVLQVRECATALVGVAKALGIAVFLVGHGARLVTADEAVLLWDGCLWWMCRGAVCPFSLDVLRACEEISPLSRTTLNQTPNTNTTVTKSRELAGPKALEHLVDAVLYLEGERGGELRVLRAVKNRFGRVGEVGLLVMRRGGLEAAPAPELLFTNDGGGLVADEAGEESGDGGVGALAAAGAAIGVVVEGARPLLVEVQALSSARQAVAGGAYGGGGDDDDSGGNGDDDSDEGGGGGGWRGGWRGSGGRGQQAGGGVFVPLTRNVTGFRDRQRVLMLLEVLGKHTAVKVTTRDWVGGVGVKGRRGGPPAGIRWQAVLFYRWPQSKTNPGKTRRHTTTTTTNNAHTHTSKTHAVNVHVNVVGGYRVDPTETGLDLPLLAAVASSCLDAPLPPRTLLVGEVGLRGELRHAPNMEVGRFLIWGEGLRQGDLRLAYAAVCLVRAAVKHSTAHAPPPPPSPSAAPARGRQARLRRRRHPGVERRRADARGARRHAPRARAQRRRGARGAVWPRGAAAAPAAAVGGGARRWCWGSSRGRRRQPRGEPDGPAAAGQGG